MIRRTINFSLRFRVLLVVAAVAVMSFGLTRLDSAPKDIYPEFEPPTVEIHTEALGLSAAEVEQLITAPLEADLLNGVAWVDDIRSESVMGLSAVTIVFEPGTDLYKARQAVQERLAQAHALPNVSKPPQMLQPKASTSRAMMIGLTSDKLSLIDISQLARWTVKPRLQGVEGVANVASFGHRERQLQVQVDPRKLQEQGVTLEQVIASTGNAMWVSPLTFLPSSTPGTGGFLETQNQRLGIRHISPIVSAGDLAKVAIEGKPGLTLANVASVVEDHQPLIGDALVNGGPGVVLVVEKLRGANTVEVAEGVKAALATLEPALKDVTVDTTLYQPAEYIESGMSNLAKAALAGLALLLVVFFVAFYRWRTALVAAFALLTSVLGALSVLLLTGSTINTIVLAGLAVGLAVVIDDAIASADRVSRSLREQSADGSEPAVGGVVVDTLTELRGSLGFAAVFVLLPVLPAFFMDGHFGYFGRPLAQAYVAAVLASMVVALLVTPALAVLLYRRAGQAKGSPFAENLGRRYTGGLARTIASPRRPLAVALVLAVAGVVVIPQLGRSELPALKERDFLVEMDAKAGTSLSEMNRITAQASRDLQAVPGVRKVSSHAGRAITGDRVSNVNKAEVWVSLADDADYGQAVNAMRSAVANYPDVDTDVMTYQQYALKEVEDDSDGPIVVRVFGNNETVLPEKARELGDKLRGIQGISDLRVELPVNQETIEVEVDLERAAAAGVKPGDVRRTAATLLSGIEVGALYYDQKIFEVVVWGTPEVRNEPADVENLLIETPTRGLVPLKDVADVRRAQSPDVVERSGAFRRIDITADVSGRDRAAVADDVRAAIASTQFPLEYRAELLGNYVEKQKDDRRLLALAGFAAVAMLLLLQACFGSWVLGAVFFLAMPVALTGGLVAALADGGEISIGATLGLLVLLGLAARHGIVFVRRCQHLERREHEAFGLDLVSRAAGERFAAVVLSVVAVALAFLPVLVVGDKAGVEIVRPMAVVVLGGLLPLALVSLLVVPALYLAFGSRVSETELDLVLFEEELAAGGVPAPAAPAPGAAAPEPVLARAPAGPAGPEPDPAVDDAQPGADGKGGAAS